jgi:hypothetical protein
MAKIISPSNLNQGTEVVIDTSALTIQLLVAGNLSTDGVQLQALYSFLKEEWKSDANLIKFLFPMVAITEEQFELINGWDFADTTTRELIRDGGWALKDGSGVSQEEWMNVTTLGAFDDSGSDLAYYLQVDGGTPTDIVLTGEVNQAIQIYGDATHGNFDYRGFFKIYLREQGKLYSFYDLNAEQNITSLTYKKYAMPLSNGTDLKISESDANIAANAPYTGMSITYYAVAETRNIGGTSYDFDIIIDGNNGTAEQIYEFVQYSLRQTTDIDDGTGTVRGDTADELLVFIGDTLQTKNGVYIDNFSPADTNRLEFTDTSGSVRTFPFVAAGNILFNDNLQNDTGAFYRVFFANDNAGANAGNDFGTSTAITIQDNNDVDIAGDVSAQASVSFDYDYDGNVQRGAGSDGTDVPYVAVASGLGTAQYVVTTGTIVRSTSNVINFVAALERNYRA